MTWKLPDNYLTSLPFGKTSHYIDGLSGVSNENVRYLPFFKELRIDALDKRILVKIQLMIVLGSLDNDNNTTIFSRHH